MSTDKSTDKDSHRSIIKSTSIVSFGTLLSRILGFFRDVILAKFFGTAAQADSFFVAFRIPNLLRDLMGEGATNSAVVQVLSEYLHKDKKDLADLMNILFTFFLVVLSGVTVLGILLAPLVVRVVAPGFTSDVQKFDLTVQLTRILFPYLILIGLTAYSMGILYTLRSFFWPAFSPCFLNIACIVAALAASATMKEPILGLAIGVLIGGILQLIVQIVALQRKGVYLGIAKKFNHPGVKQIKRLLLPRLFGSGVYQINVVIDTLCASLSSVVGPGGISAIYYANRIIQFPQGLFGVALASALLPAISGLAARKEVESLKKTIQFALRIIFLILFPVAFFCIFLSTPIVRMLFERGEFDTYSTAITSTALLFFAPGLLSYGGVRIMVTAFYALQDTVTPVKVAGTCLLVNAVLNFVLMGPLKIGGIALASSVATTLNFLTLFFVLDKKLGGLKKGLKKYLMKLSFAGMIMGVFVYFSWQLIPISNEWVKLMLVGALGLSVFILICFILKVEEIKKVSDEIKKRYSRH